MNATCKKIVFFIIVFVLATSFFGLSFLFGNFAFAQQITQHDLDSNVQYEKVEKIIEIDKNKNLKVTEYITVTFKNDNINVGLSRNISKINKITRIVDGEKYTSRTINKLELLSVKMDGKDEYNFLTTDQEYYYINTGQDFDYKVGSHTYEIVYNYAMGEDFISQFDDFTFDIMDYGFRSDVSVFEAHITLPSSFDANNLTFRTNNFKPADFCSYQIEGNTIHVQANNFYNGHGLTMQLILPEDYFSTSYTLNAMYWIVIASFFIGAIAIALIIIISRRPVNKVVETVEFFPPNNLNPVDVGRIYRGKVLNKDLASLIINWASQDLVALKRKGKKHFIITKLKDFPEVHKKEKADKIDIYCYNKKLLEKKYFNALFPNDKVEFDTEIEKGKVNVKLSKATLNIKKIEDSVKKKKTYLTIAIEVLSVLPIVLFYFWLETLGAKLFFPNIIIMFFLLAGINVVFYISVNDIFTFIFKCIVGGAFIAFYYYFFSLQYLSMDTLYLTWITPIFCMIAVASLNFLQVFSAEELALRGKVMGFKRFLATAEVEKLEMLIEENPSYYYDILPYCYVFGITKKMEKKFASLNIQPPQYCQGQSFNSFAFAMSYQLGRVRGMSATVSRKGVGGGIGGSFGGGGGGGGCGGR